MIPGQPSQTALRVAMARAIEALQPRRNRICCDDLAWIFLEGRLRQMYATWLGRNLFCMRSDFIIPGVRGWVLIRTRAIDDILGESIASGILQVVILGAGYDTRAIRFNLTDRRISVFEVDHPATVHRKCAVIRNQGMESRDRTIYVPVRFNSQDLGAGLYGAGYRNDVKTLFIWEGVTYYINVKAVDKTLAFVSGNSPQGSSILFDTLPPIVSDRSAAVREVRAMQALFARMGESLVFGIDPDRIQPFLSERHFRSVAVSSSGELKETYMKGMCRRLRVSGLFSFVQAMV